MRYLQEFRDAEAVAQLARKLAAATTTPWTLMEICGGQTHAIARHGLQEFLPEQIELLHGPGCPVCVTPVTVIDQAIELAARPQVILCSFGDMLRVPGSHRDLLAARAAGGDVRVVYSPMDALQLAREHPDRQVVFLAIGFETTAPANAMAVYQARREALDNFSLLVAQFQVPPALAALCSSAASRVQGVLAAGHVCTVMGYRQYEPLARQLQRPIVIMGFEPVDILQAVLCCVEHLERSDIGVANCYARAVSREGNASAQRMLREVFAVADQEWRGLGELAGSGLALNASYRDFDAVTRFGLGAAVAGGAAQACSNGCISGEILSGLKKPHDCPFFAGRCRPESPLGAPMVSSEGACAAYFHYSRCREVQA